MSEHSTNSWYRAAPPDGQGRPSGKGVSLCSLTPSAPWVLLRPGGLGCLARERSAGRGDAFAVCFGQGQACKLEDCRCVGTTPRRSRAGRSGGKNPSRPGLLPLSLPRCRARPAQSGYEQEGSGESFFLLQLPRRRGRGGADEVPRGRSGRRRCGVAADPAPHGGSGRQPAAWSALKGGAVAAA